jgi:hypothetical protein
MRVAAGRSACTLGLNATHPMLAIAPPVSDSQRAGVVPVAHRAPVPSVKEVPPTRWCAAALTRDHPSGASRGTHRGSCARRVRALALQAMERLRNSAGALGVGRASCLGTRGRSRVVPGWSRATLAAAHGPNRAVERTRRYVASTWRAPVRRAAHLAR